MSATAAASPRPRHAPERREPLRAIDRRDAPRAPTSPTKPAPPRSENEAPAAEPLEEVEQRARGWDSMASSGVIAAESRALSAARAARLLGMFAPAAGSIGELASLPKGYAAARESIERARRSGKPEDLRAASGDTTGASSAATSMTKGLIEIPDVHYRTAARRAAADAFRASAPTASKAVVNAAAREATKVALAETGEVAAKAAVIDAARQSAVSTTGTLRGGMGTTSRTAARAMLKEGGEEAAKAATELLARGAARNATRCAARFLPGANIAIAALDTASAAATLADDEASPGKKAASVVTAVGSIVAASNIPLVSQFGAAVSTISSFAGLYA